MSINITVSGNPINVRPRRTVLSDLEQIKKSERDRRKRLRLEQVRQQSKERSSQILEHAKLIEQRELKRLRNDKDSELRLLHNQRLLCAQQKYHEDMENIGQAHIAAARQPNVDEILEANSERNRIVAMERGRKAARRLKEITKKKEKERNATKSRLRNIRESENVRAAMISQLSRMSSNNDVNDTSCLSEDEENTVAPNQKNVRQVTAMVHQVDDEVINQKQNEQSKLSGESKRGTCDVPVSRKMPTCESDDQEPRRTVPVINLSTSKADKIASYNPEDYRQPTSEESTSNCSSNSQDSSQSTITREPVAKCKTPKLHPTPNSNQVHMYDLNNRRENQYTVPPGTVERINTDSEPNAEEQAKDVVRSESYLAQLNKIRKTVAENRGKDALLREKVRRDYDQLLKKLDHFCSEERKLKASQAQHSSTNNLHMHPQRKKDCLRKRQQKMEREIESVMRTKKPTTTNEQPPVIPPERIITNTPRFAREAPSTSRSVATPTANAAAPSTSDQTAMHYEQILSMLLKLERMKYGLWLEYGTSLPESISNVTQRPLQLSSLKKDSVLEQASRKQRTAEQSKAATPESPEIRVINVSLENEAKKKKKKDKEKDKVLPQLMETAVQTSVQNDDAHDKSVQVEISKEREQMMQETDQSERQYIEPIVKIIAQTENVDSGSSVSSATDIVIETEDQRVRVTPKRKSKRRKLSVVTRRSLIGRSARKTSSIMPTSSKSDAKLTSIAKETVDKATSPRIDSDLERRTSAESSFNSTEVSQIHSVSNSTPKEGAPYIIRTQQTKRILKVHKKTSDSSTSYASPPVYKPGTHLPAANTSTPVLEMLDSSRSGTEKIHKAQVSPVSSPETPSPRTMKLSSNVPRSMAASKALFNCGKRKNEINHAHHSHWDSISKAVPSAQEQCHCSNPSCQMYHGKPVYDDPYAEEIHKQLEELQNKTKGKIASLADLLDRIRGVDIRVLTDAAATDTTSENIQIAQNLISEIEAMHEILNRNLLESQKLVNDQVEISSIDPVVSSRENARNERGDNLVIDSSAINKPKIITHKPVLIEQSNSAQLNDKDETFARLLTDILKQSKNRDKPLVSNSEGSSGKKIEKLLQAKQLEQNGEIPESDGKLYYGRKLKPVHNELSTIKEFDTPDTTGQFPPTTLSAFKPLPTSSSKKMSTLCTSTPAKPAPENKSVQVATGVLKVSENSDFSANDRAEEASPSASSSENFKGTSSDLSGISGLSKIDSQNSIEKQLFEKVSWAGATVKKTRQSAALDSSSTSDAAPVNIVQRPLPKKLPEHSGQHEFSGLTDVSSISLRKANKSTEQSVLQKARTSTPNIQSSATTDSDITTSPSVDRYIDIS